MRIFINQKIRQLFFRICVCILIFMIISAAVILYSRDSWAFGVLMCALVMAAVILLVCCRYFMEQDKLMEDAAAQIREYISGDRSARLECDEEGEMYRLFHEINALAAILNAQAENAGKEKRFLQNTISDISHQLKTPLAALNIYNGIIQTQAGANDLAAVEEFSVLSEQELDRIETLVQNLLKITKFDAGFVVIEKNPENIFDMMTEVKKHFLFRAKEEGKEIVLSGSESLSFLCDKTWIVEAVSNLVKNALDHTKGGDFVRVEWGQSASLVWLSIKDNGSGIHKEDLYHIFKRFYRSRYAQDAQGIGLGLPLAKSVIEAHNGTIRVDSRLGEGTVFTIHFLIPTKL